MSKIFIPNIPEVEKNSNYEINAVLPYAHTNEEQVADDDIINEWLEMFDANDRYVEDNIDAILTGVKSTKKFIIKNPLFGKLVHTDGDRAAMLDVMTARELNTNVIFQLEDKKVPGCRYYGYCAEEDLFGDLATQTVDRHNDGMASSNITVDHERYIVHECIDGTKPFRAVFDLDGKDIPLEQHKEVALIFINSIVRTFMTYFGSYGYYDKFSVAKRLAIMTSSDESKLSIHAIFIDYYSVKDYIEMKKLTKLVAGGMGDYGKYLDVGLPKSRFNLRCVGSSKGGRLKRISASTAQLFPENDNFLVQPRYIPGSFPELRVECEVDKRVYEQVETIDDNIVETAKRLVEQGYPEFQFRAVQGCFIVFDRLHPSECEFCKTSHDKDNTLYCQIGCDGIVFLRCRRTTNMRVLIGTSEKFATKPKVKQTPDPKRFLKPLQFIDPLTPSYAYSNKYVNDLPATGDIYLCSGWGTGKTRSLLGLMELEELIILCISSRRSFSTTFGNRFDFQLYNDGKLPTRLIIKELKRLVVQYESIKRVKGCKYVDILIIDELQALMQQIQSAMLTTTQQLQSRTIQNNLRKLFKIIVGAKRVICLDNDLDDTSIAWLKTLRAGHKMHIIHNTYAAQQGKTVALTHTHHDLTSRFIEHCAKLASMPEAERKGVAFIAHKKRDIVAMEAKLSDLYPDLRVRAYTGETDETIKASDFASPNEAWADTDVVLYNGCLTVGLSCELEKFTHSFISFNNKNITARNSAQMLFRFRSIGTYTMYIKQQSMSLPTTIKGIVDWARAGVHNILPKWLKDSMILIKPSLIDQSLDHPAVQLWLAYILDKHRSAMLFGQLMVHILKTAGMEVTVVEELDAASQIIQKETMTDIYRQIADYHCEEVARAESIPVSCYGDYYFDGFKSYTVKMMIEKHEIASCFGIDDALIDAQFVKQFGKTKVMRGFHFQKLLRKFGANEIEASDKMAEEIAYYVSIDKEQCYLTSIVESHRTALKILNICGLKDSDDRTVIMRDELTERLSNKDTMPFWDDIVLSAARVFEDANASRRKGEWAKNKLSGKDMTKPILALINMCLGFVYGGAIKSTDTNNTKFKLVYPWDDNLIIKMPDYHKCAFK